MNAHNSMIGWNARRARTFCLAATVLMAPMAIVAAAADCPHDATAAECYICTPELREKGRLWCREHNRYEDRCWICHPDARDPNRLYCNEHFLYEDECYLCHPELDDSTQTDDARGARGMLCQEHDVLESECGLCHPELADGLNPGSGLKIRFPSAAAAEKAGVEVASPGTAPTADALECYAEIVFNQNKLARIATPGAGVIRDILVDLGDRVSAGDLLATVSSAAIGAAKGDYLRVSAEVRWREQAAAREKKLRADEISSERDYQEAVAAHEMAVARMQQARQELLTLGFDAAQIASLSDNPDEAAVLELRAPFDGEITERTAVLGSFVEAGRSLFTMADRSTMWAILSVRENTLGLLREGQRVELTVDALRGSIFSGVLTWISAEVDERTRLARARVEVVNPEGLLKARMFGSARVLLEQPREAVVLPRSAIQHLGGRPFAFVKLADDLYEARAVRLGPERDGRGSILAGLSEADQVVVAGAFVMKSQFLISRLGAGCVD